MAIFSNINGVLKELTKSNSNIVSCTSGTTIEVTNSYDVKYTTITLSNKPAMIIVASTTSPTCFGIYDSSGKLIAGQNECQILVSDTEVTFKASITLRYLILY